MRDAPGRLIPEVPGTSNWEVPGRKIGMSLGGQIRTFPGWSEDVQGTLEGDIVEMS